MPAGYTIAPHSHPTDEHVTVLSARSVRDGQTVGQLRSVGRSYALLPEADAAFREAIGPPPSRSTAWTVRRHLLNAADDPSKKK